MGEDDKYEDEEKMEGGNEEKYGEEYKDDH